MSSIVTMRYSLKGAPTEIVRNVTYEQTVERAAERISEALDEMVASLPQEVAPQLALTRLVGKLAERQTLRMQWIMEDSLVREAYAAAVARIPARPGRTDV